MNPSCQQQRSEAMGYIIWPAKFVLGTMKSQGGRFVLEYSASAWGISNRARRVKVAFPSPPLATNYST